MRPNQVIDLQNLANIGGALENIKGNTEGSLFMWNTKAVRKLRQELTLTAAQLSVIFGSLLGDGGLTANAAGKNFRLHIDHSSKQQEYIMWKYDVLKNCILSPPKYYKKHDSWSFRTMSHAIFTELRKQFYKHGHKILPNNMKQILNDPLAMAVWFMDDGTRFGNGSLTINTQSFSKLDNLKIVNLLKKMHGWRVTLHRDHGRYRIFIGKDSSVDLKRLIQPYILQSLSYKIK